MLYWSLTRFHKNTYIQIIFEDKVSCLAIEAFSFCTSYISAKYLHVIWYNVVVLCSLSPTIRYIRRFFMYRMRFSCRTLSSKCNIDDRGRERGIPSLSLLLKLLVLNPRLPLERLAYTSDERKIDRYLGWSSRYTPYQSYSNISNGLFLSITTCIGNVLVWLSSSLTSINTGPAISIWNI